MNSPWFGLQASVALSGGSGGRSTPGVDGPKIVHNVYNSSIHLYSTQNVAEILAAQAGVKLGQGNLQPRAQRPNLMPPTSGPPMAPITPALADPGIVPQIKNIVSTVNLGCRLNLKMLALQARNVDYNPKRCNALIMRIREPRTTASIFSSGKMICAGAKSEEESRLAARKYARIIQKLGFDAEFLDFRIRNIVASCDVSFALRLEGLVLTHSPFARYEPELYPGLIFRMVKPRIVLLIFSSGKVVLTGAKVRSEIYEAFNNIYPILKSIGINK
ncbi:uncharacterized protein LOC144114810 [Amblyomma americanum]